MKKSPSTTALIVVLILFFYPPILSALGGGSFFDIAHSKSLSQEFCVDLQYVLVLNTEKEFENDTPDDNLSTFICLSIDQLHGIETYSLCNKYAYVKQIWYSGKSSRSPPVI